jgi:hypothetical protein
MAPLPPTQPIQNFRNANPENPCLQGRFASKGLDVPEYLQERVLNGVGGIGAVAQHPVSDVVDGCVIRSNEFIVGSILSRLQATDECRIVTVKECGNAPFQIEIG